MEEEEVDLLEKINAITAEVKATGKYKSQVITKNSTFQMSLNTLFLKKILIS